MYPARSKPEIQEDTRLLRGVAIFLEPQKPREISVYPFVLAFGLEIA